jgi:hypothetical protein
MALCRKSRVLWPAYGNVIINHLRARHIEYNAITYPLIEFRSVYSDQLGLLVSLQLEEACLLFHDLAQQEREQFFVISRLREILSEALLSTQIKQCPTPVKNKEEIVREQRRGGTRTR